MKKKYIYWIFISVILCVTATTTSCGDDEVDKFIKEVNLVGTWKRVSYSITPDLPNPELVSFKENYVIKFNADHTYNVNNGEEIGTWQLKDNILYNKYTYEGETTEISGYIESYERNQFVISYTSQIPEKGKTYKFTLTYARVQ